MTLQTDAVGEPFKARYSTSNWLLIGFGSSLFLSALLLFSVQPIFAKMVLPRLGGTPAVWSIAMVFFQATLLTGYLYAHGLVRFFPLRTAFLVHLLVMTLGLIWLPFEIWPGFERPPEYGQPVWLLSLFALSIGFPFFAVSANAPILQAWFSRTGHIHSADPYFLYGASNLGSFMALICYPVIVEPALPITAQSGVWSWGYGLLIIAIIGCGVVAVQRLRGAVSPDDVDRAENVTTQRPTNRQRLTWIVLALIPSGLLVAVTAHLSTNIAAAPFLWVVPLALFLLTFVITFQRNPVIPHRLMLTCLPLIVVAALALPMLSFDIGLLANIALHLAAFFVAAMVCHGELVRRRPNVEHLTEFYLFMSLGGVIGGAFTSLLSPVIFSTVLEYPILLAAALIVPQETRDILFRNRKFAASAAAMVPIAGGLIWLLGSELETRKRSFFGVITIDHSPDGKFRRFSHGTTIHGAERVSDVALTRAEDPRPRPLTYYASDGPMAEAIGLQRGAEGRRLDVGIVGLGVGSLACFSESGDNWTFFEIDPLVIDFARDDKWFNYISRCSPDGRIIVGDARLTIQDEAEGAFDVLVIDAFSSDAVPVHLLTREAIAAYFSRINSDGILVMHLSNQYMDLSRIVSALVEMDDWAALNRVHLRPDEEKAEYKFPSEVMVLSRRESNLEGWKSRGWESPPDPDGVAPWTDDYSNILSAILRRQGVL